MSTNAKPQPTQLEAVLRAHTDIFEAGGGVLAIAPDPALHDALDAAPELDYDRSGLADVERLHLSAESFDAVIGDADALAGASHRPLRELARLLRPGGRLVLSVAPERVGECVSDLAVAGFLVIPAHLDEQTAVLISVRGEHAPPSH